MPVTVILARGAGERFGNRDSAPWYVARKMQALAPGRFEVQELDYPASIAVVNPEGSLTGVSLAESERIADAGLTRMTRATPNLVIPIGYSLGALVISRWLERKPADCIVPWAALIANPLRREGDSWDRPGAPGFGLAGQHGPWPPMRRHWEAVVHEDGITCCPRDSRLRTVADVVDPLSLALGGGWFQGLAEKTMRDEWQRVLSTWPPRPVDPVDFMLRGWRDAKLVDGYVRGTTHGADYWRHGILDRLAHAIAQEVQ